DAEEITQNVLLSIWRHGHEVKPDSLSAWIMRVTRNACLDALRKRQAYREGIVAEDEDMALADTVVGDDNPEQTVENAELRRLMEEALQRLNEPYRTIVILREIQAMTYEEIQQATELRINTVKEYLHRGRQMLRVHLQGISGYENL
ncbi:MAG: sigma-70 family RNA polymerase sigma factor, partial [candidate division Zixibacteria bacterium]|nr:sigma-70 family RNA polymerase sigma factor [candidate division Zixibacteria bacterium]